MAKNNGIIEAVKSLRELIAKFKIEEEDPQYDIIIGIHNEIVTLEDELGLNSRPGSTMMEHRGISFTTKNWKWAEEDQDIMVLLIDRLADKFNPEEIASKAKMTSDDVVIFGVIFEQCESEVFIRVMYENGHCESWIEILGMSDI